MTTRKYTQGLVRGPSFSNTLRNLREKTEVHTDFTPEDSTKEIHYRLGRYAVYSYIRKLSENPQEHRDSDFTFELLEKFKPPEMDYSTPTEEIMYYSGCNHVIRQVQDYFEGIGD